MKPPGTERHPPSDCPLCLMPSPRTIADRQRDFHHCPRCDLIFVPEHQHLTTAEQRARYAQHKNTIENDGYVALLQKPVELLREFRPDARRVLDYGSGPNPVLVELLHRAGYDAVGYDPLFAPGVDLSEPFDAVISVETFEHFARPREELQRIIRLMQPEACLAVMTMFHSGPDTIRDWWYARDASHVSFYSTQTLKWIAEGFGLAPLFCDEKHLTLLHPSQG
ncbi:MAG: class I SAM-dependent methyltransferase [Phycisphaerales bacterium]|nr:class I SAM-dependent methyltransferase [Phycisphaerales bacterium]